MIRLCTQTCWLTAVLLLGASLLHGQTPVRHVHPGGMSSFRTAGSVQAPESGSGSPKSYVRCYAMENDTLLRAQHPELGSLDEFEQWMQRATAEYLRRDPVVRDPVVTIPVVVHVIHNNEAVGTGYNISQAQVNSQIEVLNEDFRRLLGSPGYNTSPVGADIEVEFCLATLDPSNNVLAEPGIVRWNRVAQGWSAPANTFLVSGWSTGYINGTIKPATQWDPSQYLNIWVIEHYSGINQLLGYAQFPDASGLAGLNPSGGAANTDGVVITPDAFGTTGSAVAPYNGGRTATHEIGHFFGLRHIWGDGDCTLDDFCADTPDDDAPNYNCPVGAVSCTPGVPAMIENYMDYTADGCMNLFTADQKTRMRTVLSISPRRASLITSDRCVTPGPAISFVSAQLNTSEANTAGAECDRYVDVTVLLRILAAPAGDAQVTVSATGGSASNPDDYSFFGSSTVTFLSGVTDDRAVTLRIYDDGITEGMETVQLGFTITNPGATNATYSSVNQTVMVNIGDDDGDPFNGAIRDVLLTEGFEGRTQAQILAEGWARGSFIAPAGTSRWVIRNSSSTSYPNISGTQTAYISNGENGNPNYTNSTSEVFLRTPLIDATGKTNLRLTFNFRCQGELGGSTYYDYGELLYSLDGTNYFAFVTNIQGYGNVTQAQAELPDLLDNTQFYLAFGWVNDNSTRNQPPFMVDDIVLEQAGREVADVLNQSQYESLGPNQTVHFYDDASGDLLASIQNLGSYDYGCTRVFIDRAGSSAVEFWDNTFPNNQYDLASKTFRVQAENNSPGGAGNYRITLYFTQAEVNGWLSATGGVNTWANAQLVKNPGAISNVTPLNPYANGNVEVQNALAAGTIGDYYYIRGQFTSGFSGFGVGNPGSPPPFPIEYLHFDAVQQGEDARLAWQFATDNGVRYFEIERSADGQHFEAIGRRENISAMEGVLSFNDLKISRHREPQLYYRIKGVDAAGGEYRSEVRMLQLSWQGFQVSAMPLPFGDVLHLELLSGRNAAASLALTDLSGRVLDRWQAALEPGLNTLSIPTASLPDGVYLLQASDGQQTRTLRVSKQAR